MSRGWHAYPIEGGTWGIVDVHELPQTATPIQQTVKNAHLIAAAPDLLEIAKEHLARNSGECCDVLCPDRATHERKAAMSAHRPGGTAIVSRPCDYCKRARASP